MDAASLTGGTLTMLFAVGSRGSGAGRPDHSADMQADLMRLGAAGVLGSENGVLAFFVRASDALMAALGIARGTEVAVALASGDPGRGSGLDQRCVSLCALAGPGQVLLSASTAGLVSRLLPPGAALVDIGRHRVTAGSEPERVYHLAHPDLSAGPSVLSPGQVSSLPSPWTTFVGRHVELDELQTLTAGPGLVTLTGLGGCGKTRLAIEVAAGRGGDGAAFADLRAVHGEDAMLRAVADALGLPSGFATGTARPLAEEIAAALAGSDTMLVLDGCEEVLEESAALVHSLLSSCPRLTILATSREPLGVTGETVYAVGPLGTGPASGEAVELFVDRARAAVPDLTLDAGARSAAEEICRRLDGLPLAIELAAARVAHLSVRQIADRLDDRFSLLDRMGGSGTLLTTLDWSHGQLTPSEQALFRRLAVFPGRFSLESAEALIDGAGSVLDDLDSLVAKSLVSVDREAATVAYRMLETVRVYALAKLREADEEDTYRSAHVELVLARTGSVSAERSMFSVVAGMDLVDMADDVRAALWGCARSDRPEPAARILLSTFMAWAYWGWDEADGWYRWVLDRTDRLPPEMAARVLSSGALISMIRYDGDARLDRSGRALEMSAATPDSRVEALYCRAVMTAHIDSDAARRMILEALDEPSGEVHRSLASSGLGDVLILSGQLEATREAYAEAVSLADPSEFWPAFFSQCGLSIAHHLLSDAPSAMSAAGMAVAVAARHPNPMFRILADFCLSLALVGSGDTSAAREALRGCVETLDRNRAPGAVKQLLIPLAAAALADGQAAEASTLLSASAATARIPAAVAAYQQLVAEARAALDPEQARSARETGRSMSLDDALALGFGELTPRRRDVPDAGYVGDREDLFRT